MKSVFGIFSVCEIPVLKKKTIKDKRSNCSYFTLNLKAPIMTAADNSPE